MSDRADRVGPGTFVAVVGASGSGKDAVMQWTGERLAADPAADVLFVRRAITRPSGPGEDHLPLTADEFAAARAAGAFAVDWRAHGVDYGIPGDVDLQIVRGGTVVANLSRAALAGLRDRYADLRVVRISVSPEVRAQRLAARGREDGEGQALRLARSDPAPDFPIDLEIANDSAIDVAGARLLEFLIAARAPGVAPT